MNTVRADQLQRGWSVTVPEGRHRVPACTGVITNVWWFQSSVTVTLTVAHDSHQHMTILENGTLVEVLSETPMVMHQPDNGRDDPTIECLGHDLAAQQTTDFVALATKTLGRPRAGKN